MGTMKRGRFVKITVAESSLCGSGQHWEWVFLMQKGKENFCGGTTGRSALSLFDLETETIQQLACVLLVKADPNPRPPPALK